MLGPPLEFPLPAFHLHLLCSLNFADCFCEEVYKIYPLFLVCMCGSVCCMYVYAGVCRCGGQISTLGISSTLHLIFESLSLDLELINWSNWLLSKLLWCSVYLSVLRFAGGCWRALVFTLAPQALYPLTHPQPLILSCFVFLFSFFETKSQVIQAILELGT